MTDFSKFCADPCACSPGRKHSHSRSASNVHSARSSLTALLVFGLTLAACGDDETETDVTLDVNDVSELADSDNDATDTTPDLADGEELSDTAEDDDAVEQDSPDSDDAPDAEEDSEVVPDADVEPDADDGDADAEIEDTPDAEDLETVEDVEEFDVDPDSIELHGPCPLASRVGGFKVEMNEDVGYTAIDGVVRNGVVPASVFTEELSLDGCKLLRRLRLVCDPACAPGTTCDSTGECIPSPVGQNQGSVTFSGLVSLVTVSPLPPGNNYFFTRLRHPGFAPGAPIRLRSTVGYLGVLELFGIGVESIVPNEETWVVNEGQPLAMTWVAAAEGARSTIFVELNIDQHGTTPVTAYCEFADDGSAEIPAAVVDGLISAGVTGFPMGRVTRRTVDSTEVEAQCVDFVVSSIREVGVEVTGFVPCTSDANCPDGTTCNLVIQQCQ